MRWKLEPKLVAELQIDLPRVGIVGAAKGEAVVEQESAICQVQCSGRQSEALAKRFADGEIHRRVSFQMPWIIERTVREARTVVNIPTGGDLVRQAPAEARMERVTLVVIEQEVTARRW